MLHMAGNGWMLLTLPLSLFGAVIFILSVKLRYRDWRVLISVGSLLAMAAGTVEERFAGKAMPVAWSTWAVLLAQTELGLWLFFQMTKNRANRLRLAREIAGAAEDRANA